MVHPRVSTGRFAGSAGKRKRIRTVRSATIGAEGQTMSPTPEAPEGSAPQSTDALFADVYMQLKAMAARQLARTPRGSTLETTALVHELYLRMPTRPSRWSPSTATIPPAACSRSPATARSPFAT